MSKGKLEELRQAVLGRRGRDVEVNADGQVILNPEGNQAAGDTSGPEADNPKPPKMSPHTWGT